MEFFFELIVELVLEGSIEVSKSRKVPKYIRYPCIMILSLFFLAVIGLLFFAGIRSFRENVLAGIFLISIGAFLLIMSVIKFRKTYLTKRNKS